jgi:hypothetical protein
VALLWETEKVLDQFSAIENIVKTHLSITSSDSEFHLSIINALTPHRQSEDPMGSSSAGRNRDSPGAARGT